MTGRLFFYALTSALAGFLFGFDTVVISGAEKTIQSLWSLSAQLHGLAMSMALWGTVLGSLIGGWPTDHFGRRRTLLCIGVLYFVSAVWSGLATDVYSFMVARFIGGLGVGISTVAAPLYISEIAPPGSRGKLAGLFQFNIVFGILIAFVSNALLSGLGENAWRWMLGVEAIPALIYSLMCFALPESPRWLIGQRGDRQAGERVISELRPEMSEAEISAAVQEIAGASQEQADAHGFWSARLRVPILLAFLVAFFNQLSGINAILYFAPRIFELTGLGQEAALLQSIGIGVTNLIFTFVGLWLIDKLGRRTLLFVGSLGYIASLGACASVFFAYAPQFEVANAAITVKSSLAALQSAEQQPATTDRDIEQHRQNVAEAQQALVKASHSPEYGGSAVTFAEGAGADRIIAVADEALTEASEKSGAGGTLVMVCIFAFIAAHAIGQGTVIWVLIAEIFPNRYRASGQSLGSFTHWMFAALITMVFPTMVTEFAPGSVFLFFCGMMVLQLLWVMFMVPETKGIPLEQIEQQLGIRPEE